MVDYNDEDAVGYKKPPKHGRFVKGKSGNPKGRPKGSLNFGTILGKVCRGRIPITKNGRTCTVSIFEAIALQLSTRAASGDFRCIREIMRIGRVELPTNTPDPLTELVEEMKKHYELLKLSDDEEIDPGDMEGNS